MSASTQPEQVLEDNLVAQLVGQGYARATVADEASMLANLKAQLEVFNGVTLTEGKFTKVLHHLNKSAGVFAKAHILRDRMKLERDEGDGGRPSGSASPSTIYLEFFDSANPLRNRYQVTQQVKMEGSYRNRYRTSGSSSSLMSATAVSLAIRISGSWRSSGSTRCSASPARRSLLTMR